MNTPNYITIKGGTTYQLTVEPLSLSLNNNIIRLACDTSTGAITVLLPKISTLANNIELNVYVDDISNNASANPITLVVPIGNTIENGSFYEMNTDGAKAQVYVSSFTKYGVVTGGVGGGGGTHLLPKTWIEMIALSNENSFIQGQHYLITDFQTNATIPYTGATEYGSPYGTLWNVDGWADLSDYTTRTYRDWAEESGYNPTSYVGTEAVMFDIINNKYYKVMFSQWTGGGMGGGFAYTRTEILSPTTFGTPVNFTHTNYGTEIDYIDTGLSITRGVNQGIFNSSFELKYEGTGYLIGGENSVGIVEPLIVQAVNNSMLSSEALSTIYAQDTILYGLKDIYQGAIKGRIQFRKDTKKVLSAYYDWRVVKFRRWFNTTANGYFSITDNGQAYQDYYTFNVEAKCSSTEIPLNADKTYTVPILNNFVIIESCRGNNFGEGVCFESTFVMFFNNTINCGNFNSNYSNEFGNNSINCGTFQNNFGIVNKSIFRYNEIKCNVFENNQFGSFSYNNIFSNIFSGNIAQSVDYLFRNNQIKSDNFGNNTYSRFEGNSINCTSFNSNTIQICLNNVFNCQEVFSLVLTSGTMSGNQINNTLYFLSVGDEFSENIINARIQNCTNIGSGFKRNIIQYELVNLNLSTPLELYNGGFTKTVFRNNGGGTYLTYFDILNMPVFVSVP